MPHDTRESATETATWTDVLAHRAFDGSVDDAVARFQKQGVAASLVARTLADAGDALFAAASSGQPNWTEPFGGPHAVALLAAEVSSLASHLNSRASAVRATAVNELLDEYSAVSVAADLGVSRQKVYDIARGGIDGRHVSHVPWGNHVAHQ
ncbi:hypothetical protein [Microbacterium sp. zg-YB36]|uniref:hypothetical protein n=1 Tax=Microbacterium sp. zg-YB36 TaxID=2969407 RepID=UPI00214C88F9|nr:hypothetical protein [Microbacterium sp. zg-YB36]MDL5351688.1 hypothetical protein [Microbacterium sp. zg-YB36]